VVTRSVKAKEHTRITQKVHEGTRKIQYKNFNEGSKNKLLLLGYKRRNSCHEKLKQKIRTRITQTVHEGTRKIQYKNFCNRVTAWSGLTDV
jgi:hypothetical protein